MSGTVRGTTIGCATTAQTDRPPVTRTVLSAMLCSSSKEPRRVRRAYRPRAVPTIRWAAPATSATISVSLMRVSSTLYW